MSTASVNIGQSRPRHRRDRELRRAVIAVLAAKINRLEERLEVSV